MKTKTRTQWYLDQLDKMRTTLPIEHPDREELRAEAKRARKASDLLATVGL